MKIAFPFTIGTVKIVSGNHVVSVSCLLVATLLQIFFQLSKRSRLVLDCWPWAHTVTPAALLIFFVIGFCRRSGVSHPFSQKFCNDRKSHIEGIDICLFLFHRIYKPHVTHNSLVRSDEELTLAMSAIYFFTSLTQLINQSFWVEWTNGTEIFFLTGFRRTGPT